VEGAAAGAGFSLALACDLIVASRSAVFAMAYSKLALSPDGGGSWNLSRALPRQLVTELLMCGERIGAPRLAELGVVNRLCEPGAALTQALALAEQLNGGAGNALASIKTLVNEAGLNRLNEHLALEREHFVQPASPQRSSQASRLPGQTSASAETSPPLATSCAALPPGERHLGAR
jgi:enoyl-CoA hydratase/carnithine racemase